MHEASGSIAAPPVMRKNSLRGRSSCAPDPIFRPGTWPTVPRQRLFITVTGRHRGVSRSSAALWRISAVGLRSTTWLYNLRFIMRHISVLIESRAQTPREAGELLPSVETDHPAMAARTGAPCVFGIL